MTRTERAGFIGHCEPCGDPVNLDAHPEALCDTCFTVRCDTHWPDNCEEE